MKQIDLAISRRYYCILLVLFTLVNMIVSRLHENAIKSAVSFASDMYQLARPYSNVNHPSSFLRSSVSVASPDIELFANRTGYLYYNFYGSSTCSTGVAFNTGILSDTCFSAAQYNTPDTEYSYYYVNNRDFSSFAVKNITNECTGTYLVYYSDANCRTPLSSYALQANFTTCAVYSVSDVPVLQSYQGGCIVGDQPPTSVSAYTLSEYNDYNCTGTAYMYSAYSSGVCYGLNSTGDSYQYSCSAVPASKSDNVYFTSYNSDLTCSSGSATYTSQQNISVGCTNSVLVASDYPTKTYSTSANCSGTGYPFIPSAAPIFAPANSNSNGKISQGSLAGILAGSALFIFVLVACILYCIVGKSLASSSTTAGTLDRSLPPRIDNNTVPSAESTISVGVPSFGGRFSSTVTETANPMMSPGGDPYL